MVSSSDGPSRLAGGNTPPNISVLFVCLGNICRSTMAEGVFRDAVKKPPYCDMANWTIDSCGTAQYHVGDRPDHRTMETLRDHGVTDYKHKGKWVQSLDLDKFNYVFAMDESNLENLRRKFKSLPEDKLMLWGQFKKLPQRDSDGKIIMDPSPEIVDDPYYGLDNGFEITFQKCQTYSKNFLEFLLVDKKGEGLD